MKYWRELSRSRQRFYRWMVLLPLGELCLFGWEGLSGMLRLRDVLDWIVPLLPAPSLLMGILNLVLTLTGHEPKWDRWPSLLLLFLLPALLVLLICAAMLFFLVARFR